MDVPWINLAKLDLVWGLIAPLLALLIRDDTPFSDFHLTGSLVYVAIAAIATGLSTIGFRVSQRVSGFFSVHDALAVFWASAVAVIGTVLVCFLWDRLESIPRSVPVLHFLILASGNVAARLFRYARRSRRDRPAAPAVGVENLLLVGVSNLSWYYMQIVDDVMPDIYHIVAILDDRKNLQGRYIHGYPVAGRTSDIDAVLGEYAVHGVTIHRVVLSVGREALGEPAYSKVLDAAKKFNVEVNELSERLGLARSERAAGSTPATDATVTESNAAFWRAKRAFDLGVSTTLLVLTSPLALLIGLFVILDCGLPAYFWQVRVGRHGKRIAVYKFRTLKAPYGRAGEVLSEDERMSWFGRALRRTHLDELPQLISVMKGDMSLIGPRPLLPVDLSENPGLRFSVRPGITGWAQINGGTLVTAEEKNAMDEWYIRHASFALEWTIMLGTGRALFMPMTRNEPAIADALREQPAQSDERAPQVAPAAAPKPVQDSRLDLGCGQGSLSH